MKKTFAIAELNVEYWHYPEKEKGEKNPFTATDPRQCLNPFIKSAKVAIPEEFIPELLEFLEEKSLFTRSVKRLQSEELQEESIFDKNGYIRKRS